MNNLELDYCYLESPVGKLLLAGRDDVLHLISFPTGKGAWDPSENWQENKTALGAVKQQLQEYFDGKRTQFDLIYDIEGTQFQMQVWQELAKIPYGQTMSYGQMAKNIDRPKASRAVGAANGANRLPIVLPCHRVIGANKSLTGFGGGLKTKEYLLNFEQKIAPPKGHQAQLF